MTMGTKQKIVREFFALLEEKPADKITVSELCQRCNISRNTFYYHFSDLHALFDDVVKASEESLLARSTDVEGIQSNLRDALVFTRKRSRAISRIWESDFRDDVMPRLHDSIQRYMQSVVKSRVGSDVLSESDLELIAHLLACLIDGIMYNAMGDADYDFDKVVDRGCELLRGSIDHMIANAREGQG